MHKANRKANVDSYNFIMNRTSTTKHEECLQLVIYIWLYLWQLNIVIWPESIQA